MNLPNALKAADNSMTRMVDRLSLDSTQRAYADSVDSFIKLSRTVFCRRKTVDGHIDYFEEKHKENTADTHYVIRPKQVETLFASLHRTLEKETVSEQLKTMKGSIQEQLDKMAKYKKQRYAMIDQFGSEYKELRRSLVAEYDEECKQIQKESDEAIAAMKERYEMKNELIPELSVNQLKQSNSFRVPSEEDEHGIDGKDKKEQSGSNGVISEHVAQPSSKPLQTASTENVLETPTRPDSDGDDNQNQ